MTAKCFSREMRSISRNLPPLSNASPGTARPSSIAAKPLARLWMTCRGLVVSSHSTISPSTGRRRAKYDSNGHAWEVLTSPPPSSGGVAVIEALNMLQSVPLKGWDDVESVHMVAEVMRRVEQSYQGWESAHLRG